MNIVTDIPIICTPAMQTTYLQLCLPHRMTINVLDQNGGTECRTMVDAGTAIGVAASADFEVEGAIYLIYNIIVDGVGMVV